MFPIVRNIIFNDHNQKQIDVFKLISSQNFDKLNKLQSFYLNQQKMQSLQEYMQEIQMESARQRLGIEPMHFIPKVQMDQILIDDHLDFSQKPPSYHELPKFASSNIPPQTTGTRRYIEASRRIFSNIYRKMNENLTIFPQKPKNSNLASLLTFFIWITYALGSSQATIQINLITMLDLVGMGMAFCLTFYNVIICKNPIQFDHFLHALGIVVTIVLMIYSEATGDPFPFVLRAIRSFRLLFIMDINYSFEDLCQIYIHKIYRILKVVQPWIFVTLFFSMIMYYSTSYHFYNRCSTIVQNSILRNVSQSSLCGAKSCESGSICTNPLSYELIPDNSLYNNSSQLSFGYFQYDNLLHSYFTVIQTAFVTHSSKITAIFMNASPISLICVTTILLIILSKLFGSSILLVLLQQFFCEKMARMNLSSDGDKTKVRVSNLSGQSFAAPTFGLPSSNSLQAKVKKNTKDMSIDLKNQSDIVDQNTLGPSRSIKFINTKSSKTRSDKSISTPEQTQKCSKAFEAVTVIFLIIIGSAHFGLASTFAFRNLQQVSNRLVGVCLIVVFIVWTIWILLKLSGITQEQNGKKKSEELQQNYKTIFSIQVAIYCIHLADYGARIFIGGYILQQMSPLTPLAASILLLRIIYLPIAFETVIFSSEYWKKFNKTIKIYMELVSNIFFFFLFVFICSMILATFTKEIDGLSFFYETWKYVKIIFNLNWIQHYNYTKISSNIDSSEGWGVVVKMLLIIIGEIFILNLIFADSIINAYHAFIGSKDLISPKYTQQTIDKEAIKQLIRTQKTFFFIPYDFLCIRSTIDSLLQAQNYKGVKQKILNVYMIALTIGYCIFSDFMGYQYLIIIGDMLLLLDACLAIIAHRFWGSGSFVNKKWYKLFNFIVSIAAVVSLAMPIFDLFFIRVLRVFLLKQFWPQIGSTYNKICSCVSEMKKILILLIFSWSILTLMTAIIVSGSQSSDFLTIVIKSASLALRTMQKGFDLPSFINFNPNTEVQFYTIYNPIIFFLIRMPIECLLIGIGIAFFQSSNYERQEEEIIQLAIQSPQGQSLTAQQNYQISQIKKKILAIQPDFDPVNGLQENFFRSLLKDYNYIYTTFSTFIIIIDAALLVLIPLITPYVTFEQLLEIKIARFSFYFISLLLFILESVIQKTCNKQFYLKLALYIGSFPGSLLMMVPMYKVEASSQLLNLLYFALMLTPLSTVQIYYLAKQNIKRIVNYIISRLNLTLWIGVWIISTTIFFAGMMGLIVNQPFLNLFIIVFSGICGSTYELVLDDQQTQSDLELYIIQICIFYAGLILRSVFFASFVYESVEKIRQYEQLNGQSKQILRSDFNRLFNQQKFIEMWNKLDKKAIGMLPFRTVLNNIYKFARYFSLHQIYIEFMFKPKHQVYKLKLELFKRLHLPIRAVTISQRKDQSRSSEYMISMHDLIARFYCLALQENVHKNQFFQGIQQIKQLSHTYINWSSKLGFDTEKWSRTLSEKINILSYKRFAQEQSQQKYSVPKQIELQSWSMGSVLRVLPIIRSKYSVIKTKIE